MLHYDDHFFISNQQSETFENTDMEFSAKCLETEQTNIHTFPGHTKVETTLTCHYAIKYDSRT